MVLLPTIWIYIIYYNIITYYYHNITYYILHIYYLVGTLYTHSHSHLSPSILKLGNWVYQYPLFDKLQATRKQESKKATKLQSYKQPSENSLQKQPNKSSKAAK